MVPIDMNRLLQFVKVVDAGNISRAARGLGVPKSIVSRNLALLEKEVGQQLVYRTTRQFRLTATGRLLYEGAKSGFSEIQNSLTGIMSSEDEISGSIRITAPDDIGVYVLTGVLSDFKKLYPKVSFEIIYTNDVLDLVAEGIDVAIRPGRLKDSTLRQRKAGYIEMILVAAPALLELFDSLQTPESLTGIPTVGFGTNLRTQQWRLLTGKEKLTVKIKPAITANNFLVVCDLVVRGHGVGFVPRFLADPHLKSGKLIHVLKSWRGEGAPVQIVLPGQKEIPRRIKIFSDFCAKKLQEFF